MKVSKEIPFDKWIVQMYEKHFVNWVYDYEDDEDMKGCMICLTALNEEEFDQHVFECYREHKKKFKSELKLLKQPK